MRPTAVVSAMEPSNVISPQRPHMHPDLTREEPSTRAESKITRPRDGSSGLFHVEPASAALGLLRLRQRGRLRAGERLNGGDDVHQAGALVEGRRVATDALVG